MRRLEFVLAGAGLLLGLSAPLMNRLIEPEVHCLPPVSPTLGARETDDEGQLFSSIVALSAGASPANVLRLIANGSDVHGEKGKPPLVAAAGEGSTTQILNNILDRGAAIDAFGIAFYECSMRKDSTALMIAADRGWLDAVDLLLLRGADIDRKNKNGETALMIAVTAHYPRDDGPKVVHLLLDRGADPRVIDREDNTLLHLAARSNVQFLPLLLNRGVEVNARNRKGETALHSIVTGSYFEETTLPFVQALLQRGANPRLRDYSGRTALDVAKANGPISVAKALSRYMERTQFK